MIANLQFMIYDCKIGCKVTIFFAYMQEKMVLC